MSPRKSRTARVTPGNLRVAVGYMRASTDRQDISPHRQCSAMMRWAATAGVELVAVYLDTDICGETSVGDRPGFVGAIDAVRELGAGVLLVSSRDRLSRDVIVSAMADRAVTAAGAIIQAANGAGNGTSPADAFVRTVVDAAAAFELATIRQRIKDSLASLQARGRRTGGVPYGFRAGARIGRDGVELIVDAAEQATITRAAELRSSGLSLRAVAAALAAEGRVSRSGASFVASAISSMIASSSRDVADVAAAAE